MLKDVKIMCKMLQEVSQGRWCGLDTKKEERREKLLNTNDPESVPGRRGNWGETKCYLKLLNGHFLFYNPPTPHPPLFNY